MLFGCRPLQYLLHGCNDWDLVFFFFLRLFFCLEYIYIVCLTLLCPPTTCLSNVMCSFLIIFYESLFNLHPNLRFPSVLSFQFLPTPSLPPIHIQSSVSVQKRASLSWILTNTACQVVVRLSTFRCIKVEQGNPIWEVGSPKSQQRSQRNLLLPLLGVDENKKTKVHNRHK